MKMVNFSTKSRVYTISLLHLNKKMVKFDRDFEDMDILNFITYEVGKIFKTIDDFQKIYLLVHSVKKLKNQIYMVFFLFFFKRITTAFITKQKLN